jgi:hypothetical protein
MAPTYRCTCTVHQCCNATDGGQRGALLAIRQFRKHEEDEKQESLRTLSAQAQEKALKRQEETLAKTFKSLSVVDSSTVPSATAPLPDNDRSRIDRARRMVSHISDIKDEAMRLQMEAESIRLVSNVPLGDDAIQSALLALGALRASGIERQKKLKSITGRFKAASATVLRDETSRELQCLLDLIKNIESAWKQALDQRASQRQAEVANGAIEYNSGMPRLTGLSN